MFLSFVWPDIPDCVTVGGYIRYRQLGQIAGKSMLAI
jgi:hypothetical protein